MANNAQYDPAWCADHQKVYFKPSKDQCFGSKFSPEKLLWKKFVWSWKIQLAKNVEYDSAWCADNEKLYFRPTTNIFVRLKFFRQKLWWKKFL